MRIKKLIFNFLPSSTNKNISSFYLYFVSTLTDYYDDDELIRGREDTSKLLSPQIDGNLAHCFEFWLAVTFNIYIFFNCHHFVTLLIRYYMNGALVGDLSVYYYFETENGHNQSETVWKMSNSHGDHWNYARINYEGGNSSITHLIIEGHALESETGKNLIKYK